MSFDELMLLGLLKLYINEWFRS